MSGGFCPEGFVREEFCPGEVCPGGVLSGRDSSGGVLSGYPSHEYYLVKLVQLLIRVQSNII